MRRLIAFENVSLDGYFVDRNGDMSWAHDVPQDDEFDAFVAGNASGGGALAFGRVTYDMMAGYWTTTTAAESAPVVAERMNGLEKLVFSRTLQQATWNNTTLVRGDAVVEMGRIKASPGPDLAILGSGALVAQLARAGLIDELQIVLTPVALGAGRTLFEGVDRPIALRRLGAARSFRNGKVVLSYCPA